MEDSSLDEQMKKELVKYLFKIQKKQKDLQLDAAPNVELDGGEVGWKGRTQSDAPGDVEAGGDLDVEEARSLPDEEELPPELYSYDGLPISGR